MEYEGVESTLLAENSFVSAVRWQLNSFKTEFPIMLSSSPSESQVILITWLNCIKVILL